MAKKTKKSSPGIKFIYFVVLLGVIGYGIKQYVDDHHSPSPSVSVAEQQLFRGLEERLNHESNPELQHAKEDYLDAFAVYTRIATGEADGDILAAKETYQRTYNHYKLLLDENTNGSATSSSSSVNPYTGPSDLFDTPREALQSFYERQAAQDVEGMMQSLATGRWNSSEAGIAKKNFQKLVQTVSILNPKLEIISSGTDRNGLTQLIRYIYDFELNYQGTHSYQTGGNVAWLEKHGEGWQLVGFLPDPELTLEVIARGYRIDSGPFPMYQQAQDRQLGMTGKVLVPSSILWTTALSGAFFNSSQGQQESPIIELQQLRKAIYEIRNNNRKNQYLYDHLGEVRLDDQDLAKDFFATISGIKLDKVPIYYTVHERLKTLFKDLPADVERGDTYASILDVSLIAWGVVQIYFEPSPVGGFITDVVESGIEQFRYNHVQRGHFARLWLYINSIDVNQVPKHVMVLSDPAYSYGVDYATSTPTGTPPKSKLNETIRITSDRFVRENIPIKLVIGMEVELVKSENETFFEAAKQLKGVIQTTKDLKWLESDDKIYVPIKIHNLKAIQTQPSLTGLGSGSGYSFLSKSTLTDADEIWIYPTCRPGSETITITVNNGQRAKPFEIINTVFNAIQGVTFLQADEVELNKDEVKMHKVYGTIDPYYSNEVTPPDLTGLPCLEMHIQASLDQPNKNGKVAARAELFGVYPNAQLRITGLDEGEAWIQFDLMAPNPRTNKLERTGIGGLLTVSVNAEDKVLATGPMCTYPRMETKDLFEKDGWHDVMGGLWQLKSEKETGKKGYYTSDKDGRPVDIGLLETIWGEAFIEFASPGINRTGFKTWIQSQKKSTEGLPVQPKEAFRTTTLTNYPTEIFEQFITFPSFKQIDTTVDIHGNITELNNHWEGSHTERTMVFGVEGASGANLSIIMVSITTGTMNPSGLGQNKEAAFFEQFFNQIMATVHKMDFYTKECDAVSF